MAYDMSCTLEKRITAEISGLIKSRSPGYPAFAANNSILTFDQMVLQSHVAKENYYISIIRVPMVTKPGKMATSLP